MEATAPRVEPDTLIAISDACHRHERLRFEYTNFQGRQSVKDVEPHSVVNFSRHWYLVAWDAAAADWRCYRVDRLRPRVPAGPRFPPREAPEGDVVTYLAKQLSARAWPYRATDSPWALSWMVTSIDTDFTVTGPPELVEQIEVVARRCAAAIRADL